MAAVVPHLISMNVKGLIEVMSFDIDDLYKSIGARSDAENCRGRAPAIGPHALCAVLCLELAVPSMKIAQIAPLIESVPPRFYGGTERVVSYLTEELVRLGHDVTLFAKRRFRDVGATRQLRDDRAAARPESARSDSIFDADAGPCARMRRSFRYLALPYRSVPFSAVSAARWPYSDNRAWPTRFTGLATALCRLQ
jgi:hypothetical protein